MPKKRRKFADDGWAVWIDGDDVSTVYVNDWLNPKGKSYVDLAVRIRGVKASKSLNVYVPFLVKKEEIENLFAPKPTTEPRIAINELDFAEFIEAFFSTCSPSVRIL